MNLKEFNETLKDSSKFHISNKSSLISVNDFLMPNVDRKTPFLRRIVFSVMSLIVVFLFSFYIYTNLTPTSLLTIDINPSITVELNRYNRVVNLNSNNEEGQDFINDLKYKNSNLDDLFNQIYDKGLETGYFTSTNAYALIGVYGENYEIENAINSLLSENELFNVLAINQHFEDNSLRITTNISINYEMTAEGSSDYFDEYPAIEDANGIPAYEPIIDSLTAEELINIMEEYELSDTQLEIIIDVFENNDNYVSYEDFINLVELDISALIDLYNSIN